MELVQYQDYEEYKKAMNTVLNRTVEDFVMTGYLLKQGRDTDILKNSGYNNVNEFAWAEYKLEATQVSRYIRINDRFSEGEVTYKLAIPQYKKINSKYICLIDGEQHEIYNIAHTTTKDGFKESELTLKTPAYEREVIDDTERTE